MCKERKKNTIHSKTMRIREMHVYVSTKFVIKVTRMCKLYIWNLTLIRDVTRCSVHVYARRFKGSCCHFLKLFSSSNAKKNETINVTECIHRRKREGDRESVQGKLCTKWYTMSFSIERQRDEKRKLSFNLSHKEILFNHHGCFVRV